MVKTTNTNGIPPKSKNETFTGKELANQLQVLIGKSLLITGKPRTDGSHLRKLIENALQDSKVELAASSTFKVIPPKKRGIPKSTKYLADSFLITSGDKYNLQVWNRIPNSSNVLIKYHNGSSIRCKDINCILVKIDLEQQNIESIIVMSPQYIEHKFGKFGIPTIKYQAIINPATRNTIVNSSTKAFIVTDTTNMKPLLGSNSQVELKTLSSEPISSQILSIEEIGQRVISNLIGQKLFAQDTKTRGQALERKVATLLGFSDEDQLVGNYPDIYNQALEVKVQDSPTIDLGKETPMNPLPVYQNLPITTEDIRYLIALTNPQTSEIEGVILVPGKELENIFTMVNGTSFKCQRSIPMKFFEKYKGKSVFNP